MTFPRKGSRMVSHGEHEYRWYVRRKPTYSQGAFRAPMKLAIERTGSGGMLLVDLRVTRPDNWISSHQTALKPATVRKIVASALAEGWNPELTGSAFVHSYPLILDCP